MNITDFTICPHAVERILDMNVSADEIKDCLLKPWSIACSIRGDGRWLYFGERITCIVNDAKTVVTVVWRTAQDWAGDMTGFETYGGRKYRPEEW